VLTVEQIAALLDMMPGKPRVDIERISYYNEDMPWKCSIRMSHEEVGIAVEGVRKNTVVEAVNAAYNKFSIAIGMGLKTEAYLPAPTKDSIVEDAQFIEEVMTNKVQF
jgi:hypothetical protein